MLPHQNLRTPNYIVSSWIKLGGNGGNGGKRKREYRCKSVNYVWGVHVSNLINPFIIIKFNT
jgi:hypothetical protein